MRPPVEQIALAAGVSRRLSSATTIQGRCDGRALRRLGELLLDGLATRPLDEPPLLAIRNASVSAVQAGLADRDLFAYVIRICGKQRAQARHDGTPQSSRGGVSPH